MKGDVQVRCRELLIQVCDAAEIEILKGVISLDHADKMVNDYLEHHRKPNDPDKSNFILEKVKEGPSVLGKENPLHF